MTDHTVGTHDEWLAARLQLLEAEKAYTKQGDEIAKQRRALPWVRVDKSYQLDTDDGPASLEDLFQGRSQLIVYHFMFGPDYSAGCVSCSMIADAFNGSVTHLANHDVMLWAVSRAPLPKLQAYKQRMGWSFPWASSFDSDFNFDFNASFSGEAMQDGAEYNFRSDDPGMTVARAGVPNTGPVDLAAMAGTDVSTYLQEREGMSAFVLEDGVIYHTYSTYARGVDPFFGIYHWLDRAPKGRNESGTWFRRHDEYNRTPLPRS
jgi:predicted dithiol-disulfide oxidoreductase (DUF899 family)